MHTDPSPSPTVWQDGVLRSTLYGDVYFSREGGLAESRMVFLEGCGLPQAWDGRRRFVVAELGFGTGLNIAALLELWSRTRPSGATLHLFSIEAHPMARSDAAAVLESDPDIADAARALLDRWPGMRRGVHRIDLPEFDATLDLAVLEAGEALAQWQGQADAWFLDGFSPASNPAMWRDEVLDLVAARSAPGARAATFTVAGAVRRGLEARGFEIARKPGFGRKRERLEARAPGVAAPDLAPPKVVVIGAGIAGASLARALRALGAETQVVAGPAQSASGNPAALVMPGWDATANARARFYGAAFARAVQLYDALPEAIISRGAMQVETEPRDPRRLDAVAGQDHFEPGSLERTDASGVGDWLDEPAGPAGLKVGGARVIDPAMITRAWLGEDVTTGEVIALERRGGDWRIILSRGGSIDAEVVVIAAGWGAAALAPQLNLLAVRGQASWSSLADPPAAASFSAYAIPTRDGVLFGATHDRGDTSVETTVEDHARNLWAISAVHPRLAGRIDIAELQGRAAIRAATPDQMPAAGQVENGLFVLAGLGSRGFCTAPLLAEHLAALIVGTPSPLAREAAGLVDPGRL